MSTVSATYVVEHLGDERGVLAGDETGFEKQGAGSAGVQRQYTGTAGKITNCQIGVFLACAGLRGRALIDRELYLPQQSWMADPARCQAAKIPSGVGIATKPRLLQAMTERATAAGVPFGWVSADEAYGGNGPLRRFLEARRLGYVLAVSCDHQITTVAGKVRAEVMAIPIPQGGWQRMSCGDGSKGERLHDWALVATTGPACHLLIRRSISNLGEPAFYRTYSPEPVPLAELVRVAGTRWARPPRTRPRSITTRSGCMWPGTATSPWMLALAFLIVTRAACHDHPDTSEVTSGPATASSLDGEPPLAVSPQADPVPAALHTAQLVPISANEIRRLFAVLTRPPLNETHAWQWSWWRRRHQARARRSHFQRRRLRDH